MSEILPELETKPVLRIHFEDVTHPAVGSFVTLIDCARVIPNAIKHVLQQLYVPYGLENIPKVRSVTLKLREMDGVAYTTGIPLDDLHKEIHLSLQYINGQIKEPPRFRDETIGVITHEMVHCFQNNCRGTAPGGLIEGLADYVRLKAGLAPPHWRKIPSERGQKWDEGYQKTAWFLEWLEENHGAGTISRINETMGRVEYHEDQFWPEIFGETVETLWVMYKSTWDEDDHETPAVSGAASTVGTEPEVVEMSQEEKDEAEKEIKIAKEFRS